MSKHTVFTIPLADEAATARLGEDLSLALKPGDCLALSGDLGAGKSTLARAFLRALADDDHLEVPSPTFTLVQTYPLRIPVAHFDLYRLADSAELHELGFDEALSEGICLVEWPEAAGDELPEDRIGLTLKHDGSGRLATIVAAGSRADRIARSLSIRDFLDTHDFNSSRRRFLTGDASIMRGYERIRNADGRSAILMDWPLRPEGPAVLDGKPYPKVAHIAENISPFAAVDEYLRQIGLAAPEIHAADYDAGFLLSEDIGSDGVLDAQGRPIAERYRESVAALAHLHGQPVRDRLPFDGNRIHHVPDFDPIAIKIEARLLLDWHLPWKNGGPASDRQRDTYLSIWDDLIAALSDCETHLLLRDFHSPNIIWRRQAEGISRVGIIDFQDAMIGPTAYDVASLLQDARVTISPELGDRLMQEYLRLRNAQGNFDERRFLKAWSIMAAQRNCKLAGLWVRLMQRDGKPGYMQHMPRTLNYLSAALEHEALAPLRDWLRQAGIVPSEA
ncbi:tRNA (adenosine(37)-N6)-threonylcarbamoyltransferase complex ATPase subunit type 1 TsaE [Neorhizobium sp. NPDC001467]|uniref:tRNA (adenosine(37)-N6)-threonylcarbamoyltransferase complex ATPase subunit type 1 TsaE n=1 Tax=Neorhizobium sp. NPDC001467 TaxID=3390595 RepID=UPI003CFDE4FB